MKRVAITTLGCKVNQYETAAFKTGFANAGYTIVKPGSAAEVVVVNTCAVTAKAGSQSRQAVRQSLRSNPRARIIITGCYAEIAENLLTEIPELDGRHYSIVGNSKKDTLVASAVGEAQLQSMVLGAIAEAQSICRLPVKKFGERTRAYLRVQDGCESYCTYCIVPYTRGPSRSLPISEILEQVDIFSDEGYREVVLTGIHLGNYGRDLSPSMDITDLLDLLTSHTPHIRYRISSIEPTEISDRMLSLLVERENLTPHLHIPLQSGSDTILSAMNRKYSTREFSEVISLCRRTMPDSSIGIDVLAGFPGESEELFTETYDFIASLDCTYLHVFPYSIRPGTVAAELPDQIDKNVKDHRVSLLRKLGDKKKRLFHTRQLDSVVQVLVESKRDANGLLKGFSENYIPVHFAGEDTMINTIVPVKLSNIDGSFVTGDVCFNHES